MTAPQREDRVHAIGVGGFASAEEARRAAGAAHRRLARWLARQRRASPLPNASWQLGERADGACTWLTLGDVAVGRLLRDDASSGARGHAFELLLPPALAPALVERAATVVRSALDGRGGAPAAAPDGRDDR